MMDPETNTVIQRLERARRWWKSLALGALAILFVVFSIGTATIISQRKQIQMEQERTEQGSERTGQEGALLPPDQPC